ncbi:hypothetical protein JKP88DRAFT_240978 [Tribonema minus]|uniref:C962R-like N-terminal AEP domain-containing protein n=1 Tax=Tribonema minus TaxID=303371 RepID=A0A835Z3Y6_9STRA|nr:hypothetical protein JKP88DRAFT_240978 [Tribonema minus]
MATDRCSEFIRQFYTKGKNASGLTHLSLYGGKYSIPDDQIDRFMIAYASYIDHNWYSDRHTTFQYLTEILQDEFPFFVDLDVADEIGDDEYDVCSADKCSKPATFGSSGSRVCVDHANVQLTEMVSAMCQQLKRCIDEDTVSLPTDEVVVNRINVLHYRNQVQPWECVVAKAPARIVVKRGIKYAKTGVHVIWPNLIVDKGIAKWLRGLMTLALRGVDFSRDWDNIVDVAVYQNSSSLRMIHSFKTVSCASCARKEVKNQRVKLQTNRGILKSFLEGASGLGAGKKLTDWQVDEWAHKITAGRLDGIRKIERRANTSSAAVVKLKAELKCPCNGNGKKPDVAAGKYAISMVGGTDGPVHEEFYNSISRDSLVSVYATSVHRPHGTPLTKIQLPPEAPAPIDVEFEEPTGDDPCPPRVLKRGFPQPVHPSTYKKEELDLNPSLMSAIQDYLRTGVLGFEYATVEINNVYRIYYPKRKLRDIDTNQDGTMPYSVIVTTRGARYCHVVGRAHTSSTIYFEFTPQRTCIQRCRSRKIQACSKAGKQTVSVDYRIYAALFPYTLRTIRVLPEEIDAWRNGIITQRFLRGQMSDPNLYMCVPREGPTFKVILELARTQQAREERMRKAEAAPDEQPKKKARKGKGKSQGVEDEMEFEDEMEIEA